MTRSRSFSTGTVYNHGFRLTAEWSLADDVVSGTFLQAWRLRDRVDADGGSLRPWLLGIATNIARNLRRGDRRYRAAALAADPHAGTPKGVNEPANRMALAAVTRPRASRPARSSSRPPSSSAPWSAP